MKIDKENEAYKKLEHLGAPPEKIDELAKKAKEGFTGTVPNNRIMSEDEEVALQSQLEHRTDV